jgi:hypothetical protein
MVSRLPIPVYLIFVALVSFHQVPPVPVLPDHFLSPNVQSLWWLVPVILTTWEAEIRRIMIQGQHEEIVCETPSLKITRAK